MARTKLSDDSKLCRVVSVKLTPPDHDQWIAKVNASGLSASEFFREGVLNNRTTIVQAPTVDVNHVRFLSIYVGLSSASEALIAQAINDRDQGRLGNKEYMGLLANLSGILGAFREGLKNAG